MQLIVKPESNSHWYTASGEPMHQIEMKTKPGQYRNPTVADARKLGLLPSVTNILSILRKPQLEAWKIEQAILASLTLPRLANETDDAFAQRVVVDADSISKNAAELGSQVHLAIENYEVNKVMPQASPHKEAVLAWSKWRDENIVVTVGTEMRFADEAGYGGMCDFIGRDKTGQYYVIDFKTQSTKEGKKIGQYDDWGLQLAAYARYFAGSMENVPVLANVVLSTTEPGRIEIVTWENMDKLSMAFMDVFKVWKFLKRYDPQIKTGKEV